MSFSKLTENLNTHQSLADQPALSASELKVLWDKAPNDIKEYINSILTVELDMAIENKVDKVSGKGLSSNDFTDDFKKKLSGVASNANNYSHPTTAGNKHVPVGGASGQILKWSSNGTAVWGNNVSYGLVSSKVNGLMSSEDKKKLDTIVSGATKNIVKSGTSAPSGGANGDIYIQYF